MKALDPIGCGRGVVNMMCVVDAKTNNGKSVPVRMRQEAGPRHAANLPLKRDPNVRVGKFENLGVEEARELLTALDEALA